MISTSRNKGKPSPRWALMKRFVIKDRIQVEQDYLIRLRIVQTPLFGIYLHRILLPDADRNPHTHPWAFTSLILRGGYVEHLYLTKDDYLHDQAKIVLHKRWSFRRFPDGAAHRIDRLLPGTVTLVFVGRRRESWGFWVKVLLGVLQNTYFVHEVDWREYRDDMVRAA